MPDPIVQPQTGMVPPPPAPAQAYSTAPVSGTTAVPTVTAPTVAPAQTYQSTPSTYNPTDTGDAVHKYTSDITHTNLVDQVKAPDAPKPREVTAKETVAGQLNDLLNAGSPLMRSAATAANEKSNARGLINSSMAVGASQKAVIDSAMPIASQDASTHAAAGLSAQNAGQQLTQTGYESKLQSAMQSEKFTDEQDINTQNIEANIYLKDKEIKAEIEKLNAQIKSTEGMANADLVAKRDALQANLTANADIANANIKAEILKLDTQIASAEGLAKQDLLAKKENLQTELDSRERVATLDRDLNKFIADNNIKIDLAKLDAADKEILYNQITPIMRDTQALITDIQRDPNMSEDAKIDAIADLQDARDASIETAAGFMNYTVEWNLNGTPNDRTDDGMILRERTTTPAAPADGTTPPVTTTPAPPPPVVLPDKNAPPGTPKPVVSADSWDAATGGMIPPPAPVTTADRNAIQATAAATPAAPATQAQIDLAYSTLPPGATAAQREAAVKNAASMTPESIAAAVSKEINNNKYIGPVEANKVPWFNGKVKPGDITAHPDIYKKLSPAAQKRFKKVTGIWDKVIYVQI